MYGSREDINWSPSQVKGFKLSKHIIRSHVIQNPNVCPRKKKNDVFDLTFGANTPTNYSVYLPSDEWMPLCHDNSLTHCEGAIHHQLRAKEAVSCQLLLTVRYALIACGRRRRRSRLFLFIQRRSTIEVHLKFSEAPHLTPLAPHSHMWGQSTLIISSLSQKRDWGPKRVKELPGSSLPHPKTDYSKTIRNKCIAANDSMAQALQK